MVSIMGISRIELPIEPNGNLTSLARLVGERERIADIKVIAEAGRDLVLEPLGRVRHGYDNHRDALLLRRLQCDGLANVGRFIRSNVTPELRVHDRCDKRR